MDKVEKKLDNEKAKLEEKIKNLSKIIEMMSAKQKEKSAEKSSGPEATPSNIKQNFDSLKDSIESLERRIKSDKKSKNPEEVKNLFSTIQDKITSLDTLPDLIESMKRIEEGLKKDESQSSNNMFGGFSSGQGTQKDSVFFTELKNSFDEFKETVNLKIEDIEKRLGIVTVKLDTKTLKNLEELASSKDEIINKLIPLKVREEIDKILSTLTYSLNNITQQVNELTRESEKVNNKISISMDLIERLGKRA